MKVDYFLQGSILIEYKAPNMGYRVLVRPLKDLPILTVLYEISHFRKPVKGRVMPIPF